MRLVYSNLMQTDDKSKLCTLEDMYSQNWRQDNEYVS